MRYTPADVDAFAPAATARVVQLRDQTKRMQDDLLRQQELINELNRCVALPRSLSTSLICSSRANEQLMLEASGAAPLLVSSPHSASSPSSGRPNSSSRTSVSAFGVGQPGHSHDRSSSLPTPPHTHTGLQYPGDGGNEFGLAPNHSMYAKQDTFAYGPFEGNGEDPHSYPPVGPPGGGPDFFVPRGAPPGHSLPGQPRSDSPRSYEHGAFGLSGGGDDGQWLPEGVPQWNGATSSGLPGTFTHQPHSFTSPSREALNDLSEVPAGGFSTW